jgi:hypothetical protein
VLLLFLAPACEGGPTGGSVAAGPLAPSAAPVPLSMPQFFREDGGVTLELPAYTAGSRIAPAGSDAGLAGVDAGLGATCPATSTASFGGSYRLTGTQTYCPDTPCGGPSSACVTSNIAITALLTETVLPTTPPFNEYGEYNYQDDIVGMISDLWPFDYGGQISVSGVPASSCGPVFTWDAPAEFDLTIDPRGSTITIFAHCEDNHICGPATLDYTVSGCLAQRAP